MLLAAVLGLIVLLAVLALLLQPATLTLAVDLPVLHDHAWPTGATVAIMVLLAALGGLIGGVIIGRNVAPRAAGGATAPNRLAQAWTSFRQDSEVRTITIGVLATLCLLVSAAIGQTSFAGAVLVAGFGACSVLAALRAVKLLDSQDVAIHAQWGGLGGGLGGWRMSRPAALILLALVFAGAAVTVLATTTSRTGTATAPAAQATSPAASPANHAAGAAGASDGKSATPAEPAK